MFRVARAFTWPASGMPTIMPYCCSTCASDAVASMRPNSSGGPAYLSRSGRWSAAFTVSVGNSIGAPPRIVPLASGTARAVFGDEHAGDAVVRAHAREVRLDDLGASRAARANRSVQILDACFFEAERPALILHDESFRVVPCSRSPLGGGSGFRFQTMREYYGRSPVLATAGGFTRRICPHLPSARIRGIPV